MNMRILVTGATGFLGEHLTHRLLADGAQVRVLARSPEKAQPLVARGAELVAGEITDEAALQRAVDGVSVVYHLVGKLFIPGVPAEEYARTHVAGTRLLLAACRAQGSIERFVHCSTTGVLGVTGDRPASESAPYRPTNPYERTKLQSEQLVRSAMAQGLPGMIVRPGLVYGPGDLHLLGFFRAIQRGLFRPIGRRPVWLHPIYIDDMTEAFVRCGTDAQAVGECFHVAGRAPATVAILAATIARALGAPVPRGWIPLPVARALAAAGDRLSARLRARAPLTTSRLDFLTHSRVYDVTRAEQLLGFVAGTELPEGIARTAAWYRQAGYVPEARARRAARLAYGEE
jgi:nucleoside-diphosphate-sugar epimerase